MGGFSSREHKRRLKQDVTGSQSQWYVYYKPSSDDNSPTVQTNKNNAWLQICDNSDTVITGNQEGFNIQNNDQQQQKYFPLGNDGFGFLNINCGLGTEVSENSEYMAGINHGINFLTDETHGSFEAHTFNRPLQRRYSSYDNFRNQNQMNLEPFLPLQSQVKANSLFDINYRTQLAANQGNAWNILNKQQCGNSFQLVEGAKKKTKNSFSGAKCKSFESDKSSGNSSGGISGANGEAFWQDLFDLGHNEFEELQIKRSRSEGGNQNSYNRFLTTKSSISNKQNERDNSNLSLDGKINSRTDCTDSNESDAVNNFEVQPKLLQACTILSFPSTWSSSYHNYGGTNSVDIPYFSPEGKSVKNFFYRTALSTSKFNPFELSIVSVIRIENPFLHTLYLLKKEEMRIRNGHVDEIFLYHGTKRKHVKTICEDNLNWRLCNENKHIFGKGVSFSTQAHYASHYSDNTSVKAMMLFKVLVSNSVLGRRDMVIPPIANGVLFDTSIKEDTRVIVKYCDNEFYPLYKILFKCEYN